jgi:hypothetical protein
VLGGGAGLDAGNPHQCAQTGLLRPRERRQTLAHEPAVLPAQRHDVGDRREPDEVEVGGQRRGVAPGDPVHRLRELVRDGCRAQVRERVAAEARVHDRAVGKLLRGPVVVGDDDLEPERPRCGHLGGRRDRAVDRHEQSRAGRGEPLDRRGRQPVAVRPGRDVPARIGPEPAQRAHEDGRGADAVDVVVAVHDDLRAGGDVAQDRLARLVHARQLERVVALVRGYEGTRGLWRRVAAPGEHRSGDGRQAELVRERIGGGDGVGRARPAGRRRHGRHRAPRAGRNGATEPRADPGRERPHAAAQGGR